MTSKTIAQHNGLLSEKIKQLEQLHQRLHQVEGVEAKSRLLKTEVAPRVFLEKNTRFQKCFEHFPPAEQYLVLLLLAIGQGPIVFQDFEILKDAEVRLRELVDFLKEFEEAYSVLGGIPGYHLAVLRIIAASKTVSSPIEDSVRFEDPNGLKCFDNTSAVDQAVRWGIEHMEQMAEIYPIGGAGDRLDLRDITSGESLPAAQLLFCGRTLLEGLIRDLQGREYLHHKLMGTQLTTPILAMTSKEKDNHRHILKICEDKKWFGRPKDSFSFFMQYQVPMLTLEGDWAMQGPLQPIFKPGGHGVIWKLAADTGLFDKLERLGRSKALVRQINNPIAGLDNGLLILSGIGCQYDKSFGFASCDRLIAAPEGMNVLCEKKVSSGYQYCITNVEYTEFEKHGIKDEPQEPGSKYSRFPANTNILFADIKAVKEALKQCPIPGMLINMKSTYNCYMGEGKWEEKHVGRLESTMQNIADCIVDIFAKPLEKGKKERLKTFITFNHRHKTISVAKQSFQEGKSLLGTPEECFYDLMLNYRELLSDHCKMKMPLQIDKNEYLKEGPNFIVLFHPALGGLYSIIRQKISGGSLSPGSEWVMEIAEARIVDLQLEGSLYIEAEAIMGEKTSKETIVYDSNKNGKCTLLNVKVKNKGIAPVSVGNGWRHHVAREESLHIRLKGNAEFFAENVTFNGDISYEVPDGHRLVVSQVGQELMTRLEKIEHATWQWKYAFDADNSIILVPV